MFYKLCRYILFLLDPETAHTLTLNLLKYIPRCFFKRVPSQPREVMGLSFPNPVGLAAGLDKNADYIDALAKLGFGFIEVGTVTPRAQIGNPKPRLFRLKKYNALINRMGFNNKGVDYLVERLRRTRYKGIIGVNIGKNADTPMNEAINDYLIGMEKVYPYASYITINISSPNTKDLRQLQSKEYLPEFLSQLKKQQEELTRKTGRYVPLVLKIAPDIDDDSLVEMAQCFLDTKIDAVIATNTTVSRLGLEKEALAEEQGGLSGVPITVLSTGIIQKLNQVLNNRIPIIGVGGIFSAEDALEKLSTGATLLQVYTGLIYQGPSLVAEILSKIH
ncbi:MAG: quinone-dependent dihydroorotate dehydrogenase [Proteobacteria bacterium]|nr:quinone-dependent dihydroorotate dehydrogenase [Pseudomonadota bacterium]